MNERPQAVPWRLHQRVPVTSGEVATGVFGEGPRVAPRLRHTPSCLWRNAVPTPRATTPSMYGACSGSGSRPSRRGLAEPSLVGHDTGGGIVLRAHLIEQVRPTSIALLAAAVIGPWNSSYTEHQQRYAEAYRTMPTHVFADIITARLRTATNRPMVDADTAAYLAPWVGAEGGRCGGLTRSVPSASRTPRTSSRAWTASSRPPSFWGPGGPAAPARRRRPTRRGHPRRPARDDPGAGHFFTENQLQDAADALVDFFGRHRPWQPARPSSRALPRTHQEAAHVSPHSILTRVPLSVCFNGTESRSAD